MSRKGLVLDTGIAAVVLALTLAMLSHGGFDAPETDVRDLDALGGVLAVLASLPLVARRLAPCRCSG